MHVKTFFPLAVVLVGTAALSLASSKPADAQTFTYTLNNVAFSDGASASGFFDFDPTTDAFGAFDITTTNGQTDTQQGASYISGTALADHLTFDASGGHGTIFQLIAQGGRSNALILETYDVPGSLDRLSLIPGAIIETSNIFGSGEFTYPPGVFTASARVITSGTLEAPGTNPVPEASTTVSFGLLLALGLGGVVVAARKKKAVH